MIDIGTGVSTEHNDIAAVEQAVRQAKAKKANKEKIDLALVFNNSDISTAGILKSIAAHLPNVPVIGGEVSGFFSHLGICKCGISVILISFAENIYFTTGDINKISTSSGISSGEQMGEKLLCGFKNIPRRLSVLFFERLSQGSVNFISGLQGKLGKSFPCVGAGLSNPDEKHSNPLYFNKISMSDACTGILLGGKISFGLGLKHGWKPLGKPHIITEAIDNVITMIDGEPALRLYEEYLAYDFQKIKKELKKISVLYPIGLRIPGQNDYLLRSVVSIDSDGSLVCQGSVPTGSSIRLMISTKETCLEATRAAVNEAKSNLNSQAFRFHTEKTSKLVIVFNSFLRAQSLGKDIQAEWKIITDAFEQGTSIIGINTFGELAPLDTMGQHGQTYIQNQMLSILILEG